MSFFPIIHLVPTKQQKGLFTNAADFKGNNQQKSSILFLISIHISKLFSICKKHGKNGYSLYFWRISLFLGWKLQIGSLGFSPSPFKMRKSQKPKQKCKKQSNRLIPTTEYEDLKILFFFVFRKRFFGVWSFLSVISFIAFLGSEWLILLFKTKFKTWKKGRMWKKDCSWKKCWGFLSFPHALPSTLEVLKKSRLPIDLRIFLDGLKLEWSFH